MPDPRKLNKYLYIENTPTWRVRVMCSVYLISLLLVAWTLVAAIIYDPIYRYLFGPLAVVILIYEFSWGGINFFYRQLNLAKHLHFLNKYWRTTGEPSVDIFLPICGEDIDILRNTWYHVSNLKYRNKKVYVLDDSKINCREHKELAESFGFSHIERPNKGEMKKAGNLKYAFFKTSGTYIAILDADFAPHQDFLRELVPYMSDPKVGIVQSPQYFCSPNQVKEINGRSGLEYGGAYNQEDFYRVGQVARDYFGAAICCGTNALYRRQAISDIGGPLQVDKSEDTRTGFALISRGWKISYLPIILAIGICPDNIYAYFHQQHRWSSGRMELTLSKVFWESPVSFWKKFCYLTGSLFYVSHLLVILLSFHVFYVLIFYHNNVSIVSSLPFLPYLFFQYLYMPLFRILPLRLGCFFAGVSQLYSHSHAVLTAFMGRSVAWVSTNAKHTNISLAFGQTLKFLAIYMFILIALLGLLIRGNLVQLFDYNNFIEFWLFWNITFSGVLLWNMYKTVEGIRARQFEGGLTSSLAMWQIRTVGLYLCLTGFAFWFMAYW